MIKLFSKSLLTLLAIMSIVVAIVFYFSIEITSEMRAEMSLTEPQTLVFSRGSSIQTLANQLIEKGVLEHKNYFIIWGKVNHKATRLQAGEYLLSPGMTLVGLLEHMVVGKVVQHRITFIEGFTFRQILALIQQNPLITQDLKNLTDEEIMKKLGFEGEHPEGRFYPDTYHFSRGTSDVKLLKRAYTAMTEILEQEWSQRQENLPFKSSYEALIMASIVEKESAVAEERPIIAGVFVNRLRKNMRLQTDPTVIYGIENFDGNIRLRDLRKDTPYNTYTRHGLPPTPIALPGRGSIHAALHPDETEYLFFVSYSDGSGRHVFSTNLKDHNKAVNKYQRNRR